MDAQGTSFKDGAPAHFPTARAFVMLVDPDRYEFLARAPKGPARPPTCAPSTSAARTSAAPRTFCPTNFWFECPCHGSRYDRLGIKVLGLGPAPRSLDHFASTVDAEGVLTLDTGKITLGPLPIALGQPGVIPPKSPLSCLRRPPGRGSSRPVAPSARDRAPRSCDRRSRQPGR